jgi:alpha-L-fucosidase
VPPAPNGLFDVADVTRLIEFRREVNRIFAHNLAKGSVTEASSVRGGSTLFGPDHVLDGSLYTYWAADSTSHTGSIEFDLGSERSFNVIMMQEPIQLGQRISAYRVDIWRDGAWQRIAGGTTIGHKKLDRTESTIRSRRVRFSIESALAVPLLAEFGIYYDERMAHDADQ